MKSYTLNKVDKLGDYYEKYGQRYWAECDEQLEPLMFNSQNQGIEAGMKITADEVLLKTSAKGIEYHGLKKVKVDGQASPNAARVADIKDTETTDIKRQLERIERKIDRLLGVDEVAEVKENEEISLSDIPF